MNHQLLLILRNYIFSNMTSHSRFHFHSISHRTQTHSQEEFFLNGRHYLLTLTFNHKMNKKYMTGKLLCSMVILICYGLFSVELQKCTHILLLIIKNFGMKKSAIKIIVS